MSERERSPGFASKYCDQRVRVPSPMTDLAGYEAALIRLARRSDVTTILPFCEADIYVLARNRESLADHVGTPWPTLETLRSVQDRVRLFDAARRAGVAAPETRPFDEWDEWDHEVIVKPRFTMNATEYDDSVTDSAVVDSSTQYVLPGERPTEADLVSEMGHVPLVQEYVDSTDEYGFFALYDHGEAVATFQHRQVRGWKYCGGPSAYRESVDIPELRQAGLALLDELDWHGVAMVEFLRDPETGEFKLMEVNPRFWSSLPFTVQAGVDFPALYWGMASGGRVEVDPDYRVGIAGHLLSGEVLHLWSVLREQNPLVERPSFPRRAAEIATSLVSSPRFDYLSVRDPGPFVRHAQNTLDAVASRNTQTDPKPGRVEAESAQTTDEPNAERRADAVPSTLAERMIGDGGRDAGDGRR
nr:carboxylate--amine ligase [Halobaculum sp. YSMS11]